MVKSTLNLLVLISILLASIVLCLDSRKLDETTTPAPPADPTEKCTPCTQYPPPSPPPPSPPTLPPPPPPPSPKKTPTSYCPPPPPPPSFNYITGPPGNLYPIDQDFGRAGRKVAVWWLPIFVSCGLLGLMAFW